MVTTTHLLVSLLAVLGPRGVLSHPGEAHAAGELAEDALVRRHVVERTRRSLERCADSPDAVALRERAVARRVEKARLLREARGIVGDAPLLHRRDLAALQTYAATSHNLTSADPTFGLTTPASTLFGSNATCALSPETVVGPYFVGGELQRTNITDGQGGVPMHLEMQFVDSTTCKAVTATLGSFVVDVWHANATGVYSGVASAGQGGLASTFMRGWQAADGEGVVAFDTVVPGHYTGRASHVHLASHVNGTVLANGTYSGAARANHVGQLFFDEALRAAVEARAPYSSNAQAVTTNVADDIAGTASSVGYDPFVDFVLLGPDLGSGVLAWITVAIDAGASYDVQEAAHYYAGGGVANANSGGGAGGGPGGAGGPPGNGTGMGGGGGGGMPGGPNETATITAAGTATTSGLVASVTSTAGAQRRARVLW